MDAKSIATGKVILIVAVIAVVCAAGINDAYSYSSSVTSSGNTISADYLTINTYNNVYGQDGSVLTDLSFDIPANVSEYSTGSKNCSVDPSTIYSVRASSNVSQDVYVYGYFTCSSISKGVAVQSITLRCEVTDMQGTRDMTLFRDSFKSHEFGTTVPLKYDSVNSVYYADMVIKEVIVNYYEGIVFIGGSADVHSGTSHEKVSVEDATNPVEFEYHFLASRDTLLAPAS